MKFLLGLALVCLPAFAVTKSAKITASSTNIPASYSKSDAASLVISNSPTRSSHVCIDNDTSSYIAVKVTHPSTATSPTSGAPEINVRGGSGVCLDGIGVEKQVFLRSTTGSAISSGTVTIEVW